MISSMWGRGLASLTVCSFTFLASSHKRFFVPFTTSDTTPTTITLFDYSHLQHSVECGINEFFDGWWYRIKSLSYCRFSLVTSMTYSSMSFFLNTRTQPKGFWLLNFPRRDFGQGSACATLNHIISLTFCGYKVRIDIHILSPNIHTEYLPEIGRSVTIQNSSDIPSYCTGSLATIVSPLFAALLFWSIWSIFPLFFTSS